MSLYQTVKKIGKLAIKHPKETLMLSLAIINPAIQSCSSKKPITKSNKNYSKTLDSLARENQLLAKMLVKLQYGRQNINSMKHRNTLADLTVLNEYIADINPMKEKIESLLGRLHNLDEKSDLINLYMGWAGHLSKNFTEDMINKTSLCDFLNYGFKGVDLSENSKKYIEENYNIIRTTPSICFKDRSFVADYLRGFWNDFFNIQLLREGKEPEFYSLIKKAQKTINDTDDKTLFNKLDMRFINPLQGYVEVKK